MVYLPFIHHRDPLNDSLIRSYFLGGMAFMGGMEGRWEQGELGVKFGILFLFAVKDRYFYFWFYSCCIDFFFGMFDVFFCFQVMFCYGKSSLNPHLRWMM